MFVFKALLSALWRINWGRERKGEEHSREREQPTSRSGLKFQELAGAGGREHGGKGQRVR